MPRESKFDANKLRTLIEEGKNAQQMMNEFDVKKPILKSYLFKLMAIDSKFYNISGLEERAVNGKPKFGSLGLRLSPTMLKSYGFEIGDEFKFSCPESGKIVLEKI